MLVTRRDFLKKGAIAGGVALASWFILRNAVSTDEKKVSFKFSARQSPDIEIKQKDNNNNTERG